MVKIGQNGPKKLGNFRGFLKIILGKFLDFAGFLGDFFKLRVGSPGGRGGGGSDSRLSRS